MNRYRHWLKDERDTYIRLWREKPRWAAEFLSEFPTLLFLVGLLMASWWFGSVCFSSKASSNDSSISISVEMAPSSGDAGTAIRWKY